MQNSNDLYQQGLARETAGDIKGAIQIFERIVRDFPSNRMLTAKALLQLGRWSELLNRIRARKYYERSSASLPISRSMRNSWRKRKRSSHALVPTPAPTPAAMTVRRCLKSARTASPWPSLRMGRKRSYGLIRRARTSPSTIFPKSRRAFSPTLTGARGLSILPSGHRIHGASHIRLPVINLLSPSSA